MAKQNLVQGTLVLTAANLFNRILGLINQALILRLIGSEGYGLFQLAVPIFLFVLILTTAGLPVAISKRVAEENTRGNLPLARQILGWSVRRLGLTGLLLAGGLGIILPGFGPRLMVDPRAGWCLLVLLPALPISAVSSAFRAYFQGIQNMALPAVGQMLEQIVRVITGMYLAARLMPWGIPFAAAGYAFGIVLGETCGCLLLVGYYLWEKQRTKTVHGSQLPPAGRRIPLPPKSKPAPAAEPIFASLWSIAGPVTYTRLISVLLLNVEAHLIPGQLLRLGYSPAEATAMYGLFTGVALTLISIPSIFTTAISTNLLPAVSAAWIRKDWSWLRNRLSLTLSYSLMAGIPILVLLGIFAPQITLLIFRVPGAALPVRVLVCGGIFLYLLQTTNGILLGLGQAKRVLANTLLFALVRILCLYGLTSLSLRIQAERGLGGPMTFPFLNLLLPYLPSNLNFDLADLLHNGLGIIALAYVISYLVGAFLNFIPLYRRFINWELKRELLIPLLAAAGMGWIMANLTISLPMPGLNPVRLLGIMGLGLASYLAFLLAGGSLQLNEIRRLIGLSRG